MRTHLTLPHATQAKGSYGHSQHEPAILGLSKVLGARGDGGKVHATRPRADADKSQYHDAKGPTITSSCVWRRASAVGVCCEGVSNAEQACGEQRQRRRRISIAEVSEQRNRKVHGQLGGDGHGIHAVLRVMEIFEETRPIEGEARYRAGAETGRHALFSRRSQ